MMTPFRDLQSIHCRSVESEPNGLDTLYCGQIVREGRSYCSECCDKYFVAIRSSHVDKRHAYIDNKSLKFGGN